jgi:hypothetical protein
VPGVHRMPTRVLAASCDRGVRSGFVGRGMVLWGFLNRVSPLWESFEGALSPRVRFATLGYQISPLRGEELPLNALEATSWARREFDGWPLALIVAEVVREFAVSRLKLGPTGAHLLVGQSTLAVPYLVAPKGRKETGM